MKKLMVMLAIVASGVAVNAASVDWKLSTGATYAGQNVYAIANTDAAKILAACASTTATDWTAIVDGIAAATASAGSRGYAASTTTGIAANDTLAFLIVDGTIAEGSNYTVLNAGTIAAANVYEPPATGSTLTFSPSTLGVAGSGTFTAVPEPTSGLLLLLGMAGLALKRKRA